MENLDIAPGREKMWLAAAAAAGATYSDPAQLGCIMKMMK